MSGPKRFLVAAALAAAITPVLAAPVEIKLETLVPANTSWHKALLEMGAAWSKTTGNTLIEQSQDGAVFRFVLQKS